MKGQTHHTRRTCRARRTLCHCGLTAALITLPLLFTTGCGDEMSKAWRTAALPELETGLRAISDALISGFIELNTPDSSTGSTGTTGTGSSGGSS